MRVVSVAAALLLSAAVGAEPADLPTAEGGTFSVDGFLARCPGVLVFWNSWLPGSAEFATLIPEIEKAARESGRPGAVVIFQDRDADAARDLPRGDAHFAHVLDRRGELVRRFRVTRAPAVLLVDSDGSVRARSGPDPAEVRQLLQRMTRR